MNTTSNAARTNHAAKGNLFLQIDLAGGRFGLPVEDILEIIPYVALRQVPHGPNSLAGLIDFHGSLIPIVDLGLLISNKASERRQSTRIVLTHLNGASRFGVLAEGIQATTRLQSRDSLDKKTCPLTNTFGQDEDGVLQILDLSTIVPQEILDIATSLHTKEIK